MNDSTYNNATNNNDGRRTTPRITNVSPGMGTSRRTVITFTKTNANQSTSNSNCNYATSPTPQANPIAAAITSNRVPNIDSLATAKMKEMMFRELGERCLQLSKFEQNTAQDG